MWSQYSPPMAIHILKTCTDSLPLKKTTHWHTVTKINDKINMDSTIAELIKAHR